MQSQTIYKHWIGALAIFLIGGGLAGFLAFMSWNLPPGTPIQLLAGFVGAVTGIVTVVSLLTYSRNVVHLDASGISFDRYVTLFADTNEEADWNAVQNIAVSQDLFGTIFDYGTLIVQTAGAIPDMKMTLLTSANYWKSYIDQNATLGGSASA